MFKKLVKKLAVAATLVGMATAVAATAACNIETKHPKVRITVEFNEVTYELDYTLYRNMYPNTVRHFIELAENGVYNNIIVHDYRSSDWLSGGYIYNESDYDAAKEYAAEAGGEAYVDYLETHSVEEKYMQLFNSGKLTPSVFAETEIDNKDRILVKDSALPTLIGEFYENIKQEIKKGALYAEQGTLKMYYYTKDTTDKVYVTPTDDGKFYTADYKNNCATSIFSMQVANNSQISADYSVFGKMDDTRTLISLIDAVRNYHIDDEDAATVKVENVHVDSMFDEFAEQFFGGDLGVEAEYTLPALPIIIKTVKVTKH